MSSVDTGKEDPGLGVRLADCPVGCPAAGAQSVGVDISKDY